MAQLKWIIVFIFFLCIASFQKDKGLTEKWNSLKDFPKWWTMLERDSIGYLVYSPCDGNNPAINVKGDTLHVFYQLENEKHLIRKFTKINEDEFRIECYGWIENGILDTTYADNDFEIKIVDRQRKLVLWKIITKYKPKSKSHYPKPIITQNPNDTMVWVMTPTKYEKYFRQVDNPCPDSMIEEKHFLPVEFK